MRGTSYTRSLPYTPSTLQCFSPLFPCQDLLTIEPSIFAQDEITHCPRCNNRVDQTELISKEVGPLDLRGDGCQSIFQILEGHCFLLCFVWLSLQESKKGRNNALVNKINPDACNSSLIRIGRGQDGVRGGIVVEEGLFKILADHDGVMKWSAMVLNCRDQAFRADCCNLLSICTILVHPF